MAPAPLSSVNPAKKAAADAVISSLTRLRKGLSFEIYPFQGSPV